MNKVILMGRLAREPEVRYSQGTEPLAIARYTLAVNRRFKRQGEPEADFINCVAFGKTGEFAEKYFKKGQMVSVVGRLQVRSWEDKEGKKHWTTEVIIEEQYFAEGKHDSEKNGGSKPAPEQNRPVAAPNKPAKQMGLAEQEGFYPIDESVEDDDLPF
ncbi:single-stranded DNA-binding protein [Anaerotignum faecicola]